jgi:hypothetical protein
MNEIAPRSVYDLVQAVNATIKNKPVPQRTASSSRPFDITAAHQNPDPLAIDIEGARLISYRATSRFAEGDRYSTNYSNGFILEATTINSSEKLLIEVPYSVVDVERFQTKVNSKKYDTKFSPQ